MTLDIERGLLLGRWMLHGEESPDLAHLRDELETRAPPIAELAPALPRR